MSSDVSFQPFALKRPCGNCPFRSDRAPFLDRGRAQEIAESLEADASFHCHKTLEYLSEDGAGELTGASMHCAGALIVLELEGKPNQMMRIGERFGLYNRTELHLDSPVYPTLADWVDSHH
ncbi:hypothetical protein [Arthrobacter methylotrophus]|uniref:Uncharacterized protein n=1 Tax=Arthrobacter methylotrophus TaxID=121291 RepID=A0ABV5UQ07_9MICC